MGWIVTADGLQAEPPGAPEVLTLAPGEEPGALNGAAIVRICFAAMGDGRGFSVAQRLRAMGYAGRLRAAGPLIADQFAALARVGFDEVEVSEEMRARLPQNARLVAPVGYRERLAGEGGVSGARETG